ncbi:MAG: FkbM family methyltransferase [Bacilli bacterium]|jgi:FkbM family methyltransferase
MKIDNISEFYKQFNKDYLYGDQFLETALLSKVKRLKKGIEKIIFKLKPVKKQWFKKRILKPFLIGHSKFDFAKDIIENEDKYRKLYDMLEDETSKKTLLAVMCYKVTQNDDYIKEIDRFTIDQYFDPEIVKFNPEGEVFADCGGYIGDTAIVFYRLKLPLKKYYFIEPGLANNTKAKNALKEFENIVFCSCATGKAKSEATFDDSGEGGCVNKTGSLKINIEPLDDLIKEPITFIKMDVEGSESDTIEGAKNQIINHKPKLAVCAYHKPDDAWKLAFQIKELRPDYKLYFRIYQSTYCETVIYAL